MKRGPFKTSLRLAAAFVAALTDDHTARTPTGNYVLALTVNNGGCPGATPVTCLTCLLIHLPHKRRQGNSVWQQLLRLVLPQVARRDRRRRAEWALRGLNDESTEIIKHAFVTHLLLFTFYRGVPLC